MNSDAMWAFGAFVVFLAWCLALVWLSGRQRKGLSCSAAEVDERRRQLREFGKLPEWKYEVRPAVSRERERREERLDSWMEETK